jgi:hypothetical protein
VPRDYRKDNGSKNSRIRTVDERPSIFIRDKAIFSSDRMLHKNYYRKSSVKEISLVVSPKGLGGKMN